MATDLSILQGFALGAVKKETPDLEIKQAFVLVAAKNPVNLDITQAYVNVAIKRNTTPPPPPPSEGNQILRAWTYTMDGHDFYVLNLGPIGQTLVFDTHSEQWSVWSSEYSDHWDVLYGANWFGGNGFASDYGSNVIVGDDREGVLYFLDPDYVYDDDPVDGPENVHIFQRQVFAQYPKRNFDVTPCYSVWLLGSVGSDVESVLEPVFLQYSDDDGHSYVNAGSVDVENEEYYTRVEWRSLGSIVPPGRLFTITDFGALYRINSMEVIDGKD